MNTVRRFLSSFCVIAAMLLLGAPQAEAQRSKRVDLGGWSDYTGSDCDSAGLPGAVSGNQVTLGAFTLAGYDPIWDAGTGDFSGCQLALAGAASFELSRAEPELLALLGPSEEIYAKRYSFFTEENLFALSFGFQGVSDDRFGYQWEIWYFTDAIIASLVGPVQATKNSSGDLDETNLPVSDTTSYLRSGTTNVAGGATSGFVSNFLCFNADATAFTGVKAAGELGDCRGEGDGGGGGGGVSEVPLPGTLGMLDIALAALGAARRRRSRLG